MSKHNATPNFERKSHFNQDRDSYLDKSGNYIYTRWVNRANGKWEREIVATVPFTEETRDVIIFLDSDDHGYDLQDRYADENSDYKIRNKQEEKHKQRIKDDDFDFSEDPIDTIPDPKPLLPQLLDSESLSEDPMVEMISEFIRTQLTEDQQNLIFAHLGESKFLEDIRREEEATTGKKVSKQAVHNRWNRIITKLCKYLGVEKPKQEHRKADRQ
ncbi:MAG: hypothetical protein ACOX7O_11345 [Oscillospiraceae bacterium]